MRATFFVSRPGEAPLRLPLPDALQVGFGVYVSPPSARADGEALMALLPPWLDECADEPARSALRTYLQSGFLSVQVGDPGMLPPAPLEGLRAMGITLEQERRFSEAAGLVVITAVDAIGHARFGYWCAYGLARAVEREMAGVVFDPQCMRLLPPTCHADRVPATAAIPIHDHVARLARPDGPGAESIATVGMHKFGLPDLAIRGVPPGLAQAAERLVDAVAYRLVDSAVEASRAEGGINGAMAVGPEIRIRADDVLASNPPTSLPVSSGATTVRLRASRRRSVSGRKLLLIEPPAQRPMPTSAWLPIAMAELGGI